MKIYVAGSSREIERVRAVQAALVAQGHTITHDWTQAWGSPSGSGQVSAPGPDSELSDARAREVAQADLTFGVDPADLVFFCVPVPPTVTIGAWAEFFYGLGLLRAPSSWGPSRLIAAGPRTSIFLAVREIELYDSDARALDHVPPA